MRAVYITSDSIVSPLGETSNGNFMRLAKGDLGVGRVQDPSLGPGTIMASRIKNSVEIQGMTRLETLSVRALENLSGLERLPSNKTLFILSTTKGNIRLLEQGKAGHPRLALHALADFLAHRYGFTKSMVISNACSSGVLAMIVAKRLLQQHQYDHAVIVGADELSRFVVSGFQSLHALSDEACRPFDKNRKGLNLGEVAAAMIVSTENIEREPIQVVGGGVTNDANHISGPSRTGEELALAIQQAIREAGTRPDEIDFISAHGTATLYNDEMEANAFVRSGVDQAPVHSLKGYYGHTLGAAGIVESIVCRHSLLNNFLIPSTGFEELGVTQKLAVIRSAEKKTINLCLKTASGFGGCNAAVVLKKVN